jgi:hypothetical protein
MRPTPSLGVNKSAWEVDSPAWSYSIDSFAQEVFGGKGGRVIYLKYEPQWVERPTLR